MIYDMRNINNQNNPEKTESLKVYYVYQHVCMFD